MPAGGSSEKPGFVFRTDVQPCLAELRAAYGQDLELAVVICHNAAFDLYVLRHHYGVQPRQIIDTLLLSHHVNGRRSEAGAGAAASLKALAAKVGRPEKGDLSFIESVRQLDGRTLSQLTAYATRDAELTYQLALHLLPELSNPKVEVPLIGHTLRLFTERSVWIDRERLRALQARVREACDSALQVAGTTADDVSGNASFARALGPIDDWPVCSLQAR